MPTETRGFISPWSWSYRQLWATQHRCCELNSRPLREQCTILTAEPSLCPPPSAPALFSSQHLSLNLELTDLAKVAGQQAPSILLSTPPGPGITSVHPTPCFYVGVGGFKLMSSHQLGRSFTHGAISPDPGAHFTAQRIHVDYGRLCHPHTSPTLSASLLVTVFFGHTSFGDLRSGFSALLRRVPCLSLIDGVRIHRHFIILQMFPWTITYILTLSCCFSPGWSFKLWCTLKHQSFPKWH